MTEQNQTSEKKMTLSNTQKHFIGLTLSATGIVFFLLSVMLTIALLVLIKFNFKILLDVIASGNILTSMTIGLLATSIVSFGIGISLQEK
jgi:hypothetical protein